VPAIAAHHALMIAELEAVERGDVDRLMLLLPPGAAKSTYASVLFPSWFLGRNPGLSVIAASHTSELAERFGRRVRNIVSGEEFAAVWGFGLAPDSQAAGRWDTSRGGEYYAAGVGGSVTGRRADLAIIDDPVRSREDADSERGRESAWQWYVNDLMTRLKPGARQILVMTRWHEDDLGGRILEREAARWRVVKLPMIAGTDDPLGRAAGDRLWPEWFTEDMVLTAKQDVRAWNALYQQEPVADDGDYFKREWFGEWSELPKPLHIYAASDYAVTEGGGDFSEHGVFGVDAQGNVYVLDWWRAKAASDVWIEEQCRLIQMHEPLIWFGEAGPIRRAVEPFLMRRMNELSAHCRLEWLPSIVDKPTRARSIQALASAGKVFFPKAAPWKSDVLGQVLRFPAGKNDDAVDVLSLIGRGLQMIRKPKVARPVDKARQAWGAGSWMAS
jgi:predicted phage terminase large subunit-like protein